MEQLFSEISHEPLEPSTDRRLMHMQDARNLQQRPPIKKVRGEQKAVVGQKTLKRLRDRVRKRLQTHRPPESRWKPRCRHVERVEWSLAMRAAMMIDVTLRQRRSQPSHKRAAAESTETSGERRSPSCSRRPYSSE